MPRQSNRLIFVTAYLNLQTSYLSSLNLWFFSLKFYCNTVKVKLDKQINAALYEEGYLRFLQIMKYASH